MSSRDRVNAVFIGKAKDEHNFPCDVLEDPITGARFTAYDVETWWERNRYLAHLEAFGREDGSVSDRDTFEVVYENRTSHASAARRGH